jgi:hypothetical protein
MAEDWDVEAMLEAPYKKENEPIGPCSYGLLNQGSMHCHGVQAKLLVVYTTTGF